MQMLTGMVMFSYRFTGSDIVIVVRDALMEPIRTVQKATHYMKVSFFFIIGASIKTVPFKQYSSDTFKDENLNIFCKNKYNKRRWLAI